jgi:hypothetical protein
MPRNAPPIKPSAAPPRKPSAQSVAIAERIAETVDAIDDTEPDLRGEAMAAALSEPDIDGAVSRRMAIEELADDGLIEPSEDDLTKDWYDVEKELRPDFGGDWAYMALKTTDGEMYELRLVRYSPATVVPNGPPPDGFQIDPSVLHNGWLREFDVAWGTDTNRVAQQEAFRTGFVVVPPEKFKDPTHTYRKEGGKVTNGDLYLMARPKQVTERRAIEQKRINDRLMGVALKDTEDNLSGMEESKGGRYGRIEDFGTEMIASDAESYDENTMRAIQRAEQVAAGRNARRGNKSVHHVSAPFQKTIIGGRVIHDPGLVALVGGSN